MQIVSTVHGTFHSFQLTQQTQAEGQEISNANLDVTWYSTSIGPVRCGVHRTAATWF